MIALTFAFVVFLWVAHLQRGGVAALAIELSRFREDESWATGCILFGLLLTIGIVLLRELHRQCRVAEQVILGGALVLLGFVSVTSSYDLLHLFASLVALFLLWGMYGWLVLWSDHPVVFLAHLMIPIALPDPSGHEFGLWQKGMILYLLILANLHYRLLRRGSVRMPTRPRKTPKRRLSRVRGSAAPLSASPSVFQATGPVELKPWKRRRIFRCSRSHCQRCT